MNKTLEALLRGYVRFDVNGQRFLRYNTALTARKQVPQEQDVLFAGFSIFRGWRYFYVRRLMNNEEQT